MGWGKGVEYGGIYHVGSHGEQFSLVMEIYFGYFCNWLLHFDWDLLFMLLSKMISLFLISYRTICLIITLCQIFIFFSGDQTKPREPYPYQKTYKNVPV